MNDRDTMNDEEKASSKITAGIAQVSRELAARRKGPAQSISAAIECMVAAASPLVSAMFDGGTMQERLLFTLVLAGSCASLKDHGSEEFGLEVEVCPKTIGDAISIYSQITGHDIKPHLPPAMTKFAESRVLN